eukprot:Skav202487  [mRNA]  locus=scaffold149:889436:890146:+ [translate_table: standard]
MVACGAGVFVAVSLVFVANHLQSFRDDIQSFTVSMWSCFRRALLTLLPRLWRHAENSDQSQHGVPTDARDAKVDAALWDFRARTYKHATQFMVHISGCMCLALGHELYMHSTVARLVQMLVMLLAYLSNYLVCKSILKLSGASLLRSIYVFMYMCFALHAVSAQLENRTETRALVDNCFNGLSRYIMSLIFVDKVTTVPAQLVLSWAETVAYAQYHTGADTLVFAFLQALRRPEKA